MLITKLYRIIYNFYIKIEIIIILKEIFKLVILFILYINLKLVYNS